MLTLTWWEHSELIEHLAARPDLWAQDEENEYLWIRVDDDSGSNLCGVVFVPPANLTSPYRIYHLHEVSYDWDSDYTTRYVEWLVSNWTTRPNRLAIEKFLEEDLDVQTETAFAAAIAIESLDWSEARKPAVEPDVPTREEFWPKNVPPYVLTEDPTHIGTYLLTGGAGWIRFRLTGGMIRMQVSIRTRSGEIIPLDGFVRSFTSNARSAAAKIAGWSDPPAEQPLDEDPKLSDVRCETHPDESALSCTKCIPEEVR
jgi:hypothetical protein